MYTISAMQNAAGKFVTLATAERHEAAIDAAKSVVLTDDAHRSVYVFCDQTFAGRTYPYLVAKVTRPEGRYIRPDDVVVAFA